MKRISGKAGQRAGGGRLDHRGLTDIVIAAHFLSLGNLKNWPRLSPKIVCFLLALINRAALFVIVT